MPTAERPPFLPVFIDAQGLPCLVIGAGAVAARKARALLQGGARLTVVAPDCGETMHELRRNHPMTYHERGYEPEDLRDQYLVVAATGDEELNGAIGREARRRGLLVNVVAPGPLGNAIIPAVIDRAPFRIALYSDGAAPALARRLRLDLEALVPPRYGRLAAFAGAWRERIREAIPDAAERRAFWDELLAGPVAAQVLEGDETGAAVWLRSRLRSRREGGASAAEDEARYRARMARKQAAVESRVERASRDQGVLLVLTGVGKGKSSSAFGMIARALGHGLKVGVVQFVKGARSTGEEAFFRRFPDELDYRVMGEGFTWVTQDRERDRRAAEAAWASARAMLRNPALGLVVLDELNVVLKHGYLPLADVLADLAGRAPGQHAVVTGRGARPELIALADTVSEVTNVKHAFAQGVRAQKGIEF